MTGFAFGAAAAAGTAAASTAATVTAAVLKFAANLTVQYAVATIAQSLLARSNRQDGATASLLRVPANNTETGYPRVWAIGRRVRVPAQVMWQTRKARETAPRVKGKSTNYTVRHVTFDCAFMLNDRPTQKLVQLIINSEPVSWTTRNLIAVSSSSMTAAEVAGQIVITMGSLEDPDFADVLAVGDVVQLSGWNVVSGPNPNTGYYAVAAVTGHTTAPSSITIDIKSNQTVVGLNVTAGTAFDPAQVQRVDDSIVSSNLTWANTPYYSRITESPFPGFRRDYNTYFPVGETVSLGGAWSWPVPLQVMISTATTLEVAASQPNSGPGTATATNAAVVSPYDPFSRRIDLFPSAFNFQNHFYSGTETQTEDPIIAAAKGSGNVGGFRGTCYQVVDDFDATSYGGMMPPSTEAIIEPDLALTWPEAFGLLCERHGISRWLVDATGVDPVPCHGFYLRGPVSGERALQQALLLRQVATQDRAGKLAFFQIDNADQVAIQNGATFSDFGAVVGGQPNVEQPVVSQVDEAELPTSVGIRFQDPDNNYGTNFETFGMRFPSASTEENRQDLDFSNVVMSPREARNLAATIVRRSRINSRTYSFTLPKRYAHVLENDLMSWTDDQGTDRLIRVTRRDIGTNFLVRIEGVEERADVQVYGSPVQSSAGVVTSTPTPPAEITAVVLDSPPVDDAWGLSPGLQLVACSRAGSSWAGVTVYLSGDQGANWHLVDTMTREHPIGNIDTDLLSATPSESLGSSTLVWDATNSVDIRLDQTGYLPIVTLSESAIEEGWNWFAIVSPQGQVTEVFGARDVLQIGVNQYRLSYLLRGLRGTWQGCAATHAAGSTVVSLSPFTWQISGRFVPVSGLSSPSEIQVKFVPPGKDLATTETYSIQTRRRNVEPFALRDITKKYDATTSSITFTAKHWTRTNVSPGSTGPYPLDEPYEAYRFTLYDKTGTQALYQRTKSAQNTGSATLRDTSVTFTSAEQTTGGYTPGPSETYWIDVQQIGQYADSPSTLQEL